MHYFRRTSVIAATNSASKWKPPDIGTLKCNGDVADIWSEKSAESGTTRPIRLRLEAHRSEFDTRYDTHQ